MSNEQYNKEIGKLDDRDKEIAKLQYTVRLSHPQSVNDRISLLSSKKTHKTSNHHAKKQILVDEN